MQWWLKLLAATATTNKVHLYSGANKWGQNLTLSLVGYIMPKCKCTVKVISHEPSCFLLACEWDIIHPLSTLQSHRTGRHYHRKGIQRQTRHILTSTPLHFGQQTCKYSTPPVLSMSLDCGTEQESPQRTDMERMGRCARVIVLTAVGPGSNPVYNWPSLCLTISSLSQLSYQLCYWYAILFLFRWDNAHLWTLHKLCLHRS